MIECGRTNIRCALAYTNEPLGAGVPSAACSAPAVFASRVTNRNASWFTATKKMVHFASVTALPRPWPRRSKRGRKR